MFSAASGTNAELAAVPPVDLAVEMFLTLLRLKRLWHPEAPPVRLQSTKVVTLLFAFGTVFMTALTSEETATAPR